MQEPADVIAVVAHAEVLLDHSAMRAVVQRSVR